MAIPFYQHDLGEPELEAVRRVLAGPILTTGEVVSTVERRFADYLGRRHALAVTSCTGALHLSLLALGIGAGDEVITTPMTFIATSTAIMEAGATPVFVDVEATTGNMDASRIESAITKKTKAIMPVHLYGYMCDMRAIRTIADQHGLFVIEDAAHCVEGMRDGIRVGELGDTTCFSFYATKNLTCGEGGAVVTDRDTLAEKLRLLRQHGMTKTAADRHREGYQHWDMTVLGWKYNMDNIHAALLLPQLDRVEENWRKRDAVAQWYAQRLKECLGLSLPSYQPGARHARHLYPVWIGNGRRDGIIQGLQREGIGVVVNYRAIHLLTYFRETFGFRVGVFPNAERIGNDTISLPFYAAISEEQVVVVTDTLARLLKEGA
ncbi:MAG: DegT/DnrJ/EryC1/StrS family aminotransferase [Nitrospira sp.]|nr:MAG: DegT/DnrJ/EryC1/StrS family aminotransferase [Nitrospira sp.]